MTNYNLSDGIWSLTEFDIDRIALGAGVLGTGGGGNPYLGMLMAKNQLREGRKITLIKPENLAPDECILAVAAIGAPTVGVERMAEGGESLRLVQIMEKHIGRKIDALIADEIGGSNAINPMIAAAKLGIPVVDADGMGRAFPEVQMTTFFINGHVSHPAALSDFEGNSMVVTNAKSPEMLEKLLRAGTVAMGSAAYFATAPMTGNFVKQFGVPNTISKAWRLGDTILHAQTKKADPVAAIIDEMNGKKILTGKVIDIERIVSSGFTRARVKLVGLGDDAGRELSIDIQNENLIATENGECLVMVPDLICMVDSETGRPIGTEEQRYGLRVTVIAAPAHHLLKTELALKSLGPRAFGYKFDYVDFQTV